MRLVLDALTRLMAPVLCFTAEEVWQTLKGGDARNAIEESIHTLEFPGALDLPQDEGIDERWDHLLQVREVVLKSLEVARAEGRIGNSLEAHVLLEAEDESLALLQRYAGFLADLFIVSEVTLGRAAASAGPAQQTPPLSVRVDRAQGTKCERCWHITTD